jgi:hypothetical protein
MLADTGAVLLFLALALISATIVCIGLLIFLSDLKVIRLKRRVDYLKWGIAGGILICSFLAIMQCNRIKQANATTTQQ